MTNEVERILDISSAVVECCTRVLRCATCLAQGQAIESALRAAELRGREKAILALERAGWKRNSP